MFPLILVGDRVIRQEELLLLNTTFPCFQEAIKIRYTVNLITACQGKRHTVILNFYIQCKILMVLVMGKHGEKALTGKSLQLSPGFHLGTGEKNYPSFLTSAISQAMSLFSALCYSGFINVPSTLYTSLGQGHNQQIKKSNVPGSSLPARFISTAFQRHSKKGKAWDGPVSKLSSLEKYFSLSIKLEEQFPTKLVLCWGQQGGGDTSGRHTRSSLCLRRNMAEYAFPCMIQ